MHIEDPPERVHGQVELRRWLLSIGIKAKHKTVADACEELRLFGGPSAEITQRSMKSIVSLLTQTSYEIFMQRWGASPQSSPIWFDKPVKREPTGGRFGGIFALFIAVEGREHLVRLTTGRAFVAFTRAEFWSWPIEPRQYATSMARFATSRLALAGDAVVPVEPKTASVMCVRIMRKGVMRAVRVPGEEFGVADRTPLIAPLGWEGWPYWRAKVQSQFPDAVWTVYSGREDLDRLTRERTYTDVTAPE